MNREPLVTKPDSGFWHDANPELGREAIDYIDRFDYDKVLPADAANLRNLVYALITVALAVEVWKQPRVKHSTDTVLTRFD